MITFGSGGVMDYLDHGITGWLVTRYDADGLAQALTNLFSNYLGIEFAAE